jgi:hypothetical protein
VVGKVGVFAAAISVAVAGSIALAGSDSKLPGKDETFTARAGHAVSAPTADALARGISARRATQTRVKYFESNSFDIPASGRDDFFMRCPRRFGAINGYWGTEGGIVADYSAVGRSSLRRWDFGLMNLTTGEASYFTGIVCVKP